MLTTNLFFGPDSLLAYIGLGPGQELIPYFFALLSFIGVVLLAVLQWPIVAFLRLFRKSRPEGKAEASNLDQTPAATEAIVEATVEKP